MFRLFANNRSSFISLALFLVCFGFYQFLHLPISLYPNTSKPVIKLQMFYKQDIAQFMQFWGEKIETSLKNIKDVELVEGEYRQGKAVYYIHFDWNKDNDEAIRDVGSIAASYQAQLSRELPPFKVGFYNPGSECYLVVDSDKLDADELSHILANKLQPALDEIPGVSKSMVTLFGEQHVTVKIDPLKVAEYKLSIQDVMDIIQIHEFDYALGNLSTQRNGQIAMRVERGIEDMQQIEQITVGKIAGREIKLNEIAEVVFTRSKMSRMLQLDGRNAVAVAVWPKPDANLYQLARAFFTTSEDFVKDIGNITVLNDPSIFIGKAMKAVMFAIFTGMAIASLSVLLFFRSFSKTLVVSLAMPLSLMGAGAIMHFSGVGINLLSLGAMSVSIGMVIDGAVVVVDNIYYHQKRQTGLTTFDAVREVAPSIVASVITTIIVFMPMAFTAPIASALLSDIALVVISIMLFSLFINLIFLPVILSYMPQKQANYGLLGRLIEALLNAWANSYLWCLRHVLQRKLLQLVIIICTVGMGVYSAQLLPTIKQELIAKPKAEIIDVIVGFKKDGLEMRERAQLAETVRQEINSQFGDKIKFAYTDIRANAAYISIHLTSHEVFEQTFADIQAMLKSDEELDLEAMPWITSALAVPDFPALRLLVTEETEQQRRQQLINIQAHFKAHEAVSRVKITPKPQKSTKFALSIQHDVLTNFFPLAEHKQIQEDLADYVGLVIEEKYLAQIEIEGEKLMLYSQVGSELIDQVERIGALPFFYKDKIFHLRDLLDIQETKEWKLYYSRNTQPIYMAEIWLKDSAIESPQQVLETFYQTLPKGQAIPFIVDQPDIVVKEGIDSLLKALALAFALVFLCVHFMFKRVLVGILICAVIPFGIMGAIIALAYFESTLSLNSMLGIIMLCGISVNNSIIFVDVYQRIASRFEHKIDAVVEAAKMRFRAIMVTNMTTIAGLAPLAFGLGSSGKILQPLGISVTFGIAIGTFFTMYLIPILLLYVMPIQHGNQQQEWQGKALTS
ncbi:efflux RND transporter permease subunit [Aestuariibacter sp. AA17]|uniref:Efflux RND transporter permease subunit n=1 Tax=Fluctibacter corallii TaxID=2984329 RepID=A0ABT3A702_9ALTE|nr:efflux RND transporter permease subunit [Aestuariibacter sp. AA17]MCV2884456.1 efflux RND transporter permease subunit [Aestuariibacter sp. AA17]